MYRFFEMPLKAVDNIPFFSKSLGGFTLVCGCSAFGDLFLRETDTGEYAILVHETFGIERSGTFSKDDFEKKILGNPRVVEALLKKDIYSALRSRLGDLAIYEVYYPVPSPAIGGSGNIDSYDKGGLWEHLAIEMQIRGMA